MKKLIFFLLVPVFGFFTSCDMHDDGYSLNEAWVGYGLVQKDSGSESVTISMDDGELLFPSVDASLLDNFKNNDRVLINFTILGNKENANHDEQYYVKINSIRKILYKGIIELSTIKADSIGNDPIRVDDNWVKKNMLNLELRYVGGNKTHLINLVKTSVPVNGTDPVVLELRHNANNDTGHFPLSAIVTFDLSTLKIPGKTSTKFKVTAKGFDGDDFEFSSEYKY